MINTKRAKQLIIILMAAFLVLIATGMANPSSDDTIRRTKSSQEYDDGIVPLGEIKKEENYTEWTAAKPVYIPAEDAIGTVS